MSKADLAGGICPTLLISGERTSWMLAQMARDLPRAAPFLRREIVAEARHYPHLSDPHVENPLVVEFLVRVNTGWQDTAITLRQVA